MIRVLLSKSTCLIMKFANRVIVSANRKCTWNSREIRTWKRVVLMGKRLKIIYIKILWGGKYNKYIIKFVLWDCFLDIFAVEAYTASWIEMPRIAIFVLSSGVEAYTASWIEISSSVPAIRLSIVEAYTASWIEIVFNIAHGSVSSPSKPIRLRGLKWFHPQNLCSYTGRSLYGFVDWNI